MYNTLLHLAKDGFTLSPPMAYNGSSDDEPDKHFTQRAVRLTILKFFCVGQLNLHGFTVTF